MNVKIRHSKLVNSPALPVAVEGWAELCRTGLTSGGIVIDWQQDVVYAEYEGHCIGVIVYKYQEWNRAVGINIGYVTSPWKGRHVYSKLWDALKKKAKELGACKIVSSAHVNNKRMQAISEHFGRMLKAYTYEYEV